MLEDPLGFNLPNPFPNFRRRAVPALPEPVSSNPVPTRPVTPGSGIPELDFDHSTVSESDTLETDDEDDDSESDDQDDESESDDQDDDSESDDQDDESESDDQDDDSESDDQDDESESDDQDDDSEFEDNRQDSGYEDGPDPESDDGAELLYRGIMRALRRISTKLRLLGLEVEKYEARTAVRTEPVNDVSHSDVSSFVIDVSHLDVHNELPPKSAAVSLLAGQQNELVRCLASFLWWLTEREPTEYSILLFLYLVACDCVAVLAGAALCATFRVVAKALLSIATQPLNELPFAWLDYAPFITVVSVALDCGIAREWERVMWAPLPVFRLRRRWAGARRRFVNMSFSLFVVLSLVHTAFYIF